jgi:hypothetical protein
MTWFTFKSEVNDEAFLLRQNLRVVDVTRSKQSENRANTGIGPAEDASIGRGPPPEI